MVSVGTSLARTDPDTNCRARPATTRACPPALFVAYGLYWTLPASTRYRSARQQA